MRDDTYAGKVAMITGGASGIGAAIGRALGARGVEVVLADRQVALAEKVAADIRGSGGRACAAELDVRDLASMTRVVAETVARSRRIDFLFNNAGIAVGGEVDTYAPKDWDDVFDVNLRGVAYGIQCVYPVMIRQRSGHIINTASMAGLVPTPGTGSYVATKHAVVGISRCLRIEAKRHGVRVSALCPGAIRTPILTGGKFGRYNTPAMTDDKMLEMWARTRPMDVDVFAQKVLRAVARNEGIIVVPGWWKAFWYLDRLSPALSARVWEALIDRMRIELAAAGVEMGPRADESASPPPRRVTADA